MGPKTMKNLYENIINGIENWLDNIHSSYGIAPTTTLVILGILLVLLIFMISNGKKHKKLRKMAEQNQAAAIYLKDNMDSVLEGMGAIEDTLMDFGDKLEDMEQKSVRQPAGQAAASNPNPSIIYIDNRQGATGGKVDTEEILGNINRVSPVGFEKAMEEPEPVAFAQEDIGIPFEEDEEFEVKEVEPRAIYTDRTSGVSKSGKEYTLEQLQKQIKD